MGKPPQNPQLSAKMHEADKGEAAEIEKALRIVEWRRGMILGNGEPGKRTDLQPVPCVGQVKIAKQTASRYRKIARYWNYI
ncbi:MAG: hypothetical protein ACE5JB_04375 [bacterium]